MHAITLAVSQLVERHLPVADTSVKEKMWVLTFLTKQDQASCVCLLNRPRVQSLDWVKMN